MKLKVRILPASLLLLALICPRAISAPAPADNGFLNDASQHIKLNEVQARDLEERVKQLPTDGHARAELLGYYLVKQYTSADLRPMRRAHVLWMIQNHPGDSFTSGPFCEMSAALDAYGFIQARDLWKQQVEKSPDSAPVLGNAAHFFVHSDPAQSEALYVRAIGADPKNPQWPHSLAECRMSNLAGAADPHAEAKKALAEFEQAMNLSATPEEKFYVVTDMTNAAFESGDMNAARRYAENAIKGADQFPNTWNTGNAIFDANTILGRIDLAAGDVESAKAHLLASAKTDGSPQLRSFGPNMTLARELLEKGERQIVLDFFDLCGKFWKSGGDKLKSWSATVRAGGTPDFGVNLKL